MPKPVESPSPNLTKTKLKIEQTVAKYQLAVAKLIMKVGQLGMENVRLRALLDQNGIKH